MVPLHHSLGRCAMGGTSYGKKLHLPLTRLDLGSPRGGSSGEATPPTLQTTRRLCREGARNAKRLMGRRKNALTASLYVDERSRHRL